MFERSETDLRRVIIIDAMHLFYKYAFGGATRLSTTLMVDGIPTVVDTTFPAYFIKQIHRWSNYGSNPMVICFDGAGCSRSRKAYFTKYSESCNNGTTIAYKGTRTFQDDTFYKGIDLTKYCLERGGVSWLCAEGYEADDLIKASVDTAKEKYPDLPIDVITGDQDLLPLVDEQVSVFIVTKKFTWAESKELEKRGYFQVTPDNFQEYVEGLTAYNKLFVPYNSILLTKLLRGDKSDEIPAYPKFTPTKYRNLIGAMWEDDVDFTSVFRYDTPEGIISYRSTKEPIPEELIDTTPREMKMIVYQEPKALVQMCDILANYLDDAIIDHVKFIYKGINLNGVFSGLSDLFDRRPAKVSPAEPYSEGKLQQAVSELAIKLPMAN